MIFYLFFYFLPNICLSSTKIPSQIEDKINVDKTVDRIEHSPMLII